MGFPPSRPLSDVLDPNPRAPRKPRAQSRLRALAWLPWLSLGLALLAYVLVGVFRYQQLRAEADLRLDRVLRIATEHALKVMDTTETLLARVGDITDGPTERLSRDEMPIHALLRALGTDKPQLQNILVFGPDGRPRVTSRFFPAPAVDASDRDYFRWHLEGRGGLYVSEPLVSRTTGEPFFDISMARREPDGRFGGVISISLLTD